MSDHLPLNDLKISAEEIKKQKKSFAPISENGISEIDKYPYGTRLDFNDETLKKIPGMADLDVEDSIIIEAECEVVRKNVTASKSEGGETKKRTNLELQIKEIGFSNKKNFDGSFDEAANKKRNR